MKTWRTARILILLASGMPACAHRLDEYLQATTISLEKDRVQAQIRLTPGVSVSSYMIGTIDTNHDGILSRGEQQAYADQVLREVSLTLNAQRLPLQPLSVRFPKISEMKEGLGTIEISFAADASGSLERQLVFENHHQSPIAAYLVNCLVPQDRDIQITAQRRSYEQSVYQVSYRQGGVRPGPLSLAWWSLGRSLAGSAATLLLAGLVLWWRSSGPERGVRAQL